VNPHFVMAGLVPAIHVLFACFFVCKDVDARHKAGHDALRGSAYETTRMIASISTVIWLGSEPMPTAERA
jgi:hypothetical protein